MNQANRDKCVVETTVAIQYDVSEATRITDRPD